MKEKLMRFMYGRYGVDSFNKFLLGAGLVFVLLGSFSRSRLCNLLAWALIVYCYYRMFSKQLYKRAAENQAFLNKTAKVRGFFASQKRMFQQRKTHHIYRCPSCHQKIRIPRGKGKIEISCPKCQTRFIKRS